MPPPHLVVFRRLAPALLLAIALACDSSEVETVGNEAEPAAADVARRETPVPPVADTPQAILTAAAANDAPRRAKRAPGERPLPAFSGRTVDGKRLAISDFIGKRLLLYFFNPMEAGADVPARAVARIAEQAKRHNFNVVGIGVASTASRIRTFSKLAGLDFPIIDDSDGTIMQRLRVPPSSLVLGVDSEGYTTFVHTQFNTTAEDADEKVYDTLRESLRIPRSELPASDELIQHPSAPLFTTNTLDGESFSLADLSGKPVVLMFFLHTCPHCHHALEFFKDALPKIPEANRPTLIGVSLQNRPTTVRSTLAADGLDFFTVVFDPDQKIMQAYALEAGVPDIMLIDREGKIVYRSQGWRDERDPALMRMYLARIADVRPPMLLSRTGFSGNDVCSACHEAEAATWEYTTHARAFGTLVTHGEDRNAECVSCHVVGFERVGGYGFDAPHAYLENVGCESCHGRGGPHISPDFIAEQPKGYQSVCEGCHNPEHSLGFEFASFHQRISHAAIKAMSGRERAELATGAGHERTLLPTKADHVGSKACRPCHESEFTTWAASPHARSIEPLVAKQKAGDGDCLKCHTTGFGKTGGFPNGATASAGQDLARVGCEDCHGPGGDHVKEGDKRIGTIVSLGDKCDSCVILQICGGCHDAENDPDFEFEIQEHIERQRHGTIEAGTGKPLGTSAGTWPPRSAEQELADFYALFEEAG